MESFCYFCRMETKGRKDVALEEAGRYCLDLSKLVFGGIILAGIMDLDVDLKLLLLIGAIIVVVLFAFGYALLLLSNPKKN